MNKKLLFLAGLAPLVAAPALVVASCSTSDSTNNGGTTGDVAEKLPSEGVSDLVKAIDNVKRLFKDHAATFSLYKPSQFGPAKTSKAAAVPKAYLPILDPRQNFGFETKYEALEDKDADGTKKVKVKFTRGTETKDEEITIDGFLTTNGETNEKKDELNPEKVLVGFRRNSSSTNPIPVAVNGLIKAELKDKKLDEYLTKDAQAIIDEVKDQILVKSGSSKGDTTEKSKIVAAEPKPFQWDVFGVKKNAIGIKIQIAKANGTSKKDDSAKEEKSGVYLLKVQFGDDAELNSQNFEAQAYGFATFNNPVKVGSKENNWYLDKKASQIKSTEELMAQLDPDLLKGLFVPTDITLIENSANDSEGSLRIKVKLGFKGDTPKLMNIKLYGFKIG